MPTSPQTPNPRSTERRWLQITIQSFVQWSPLGGSSWMFIHFLLRQEWLVSLIMFPVLVVTIAWAAFSEGFLARWQEIWSDRGRKDADHLMDWLTTLGDALSWQLSGFEKKYLKCLADRCTFSDIEGYKPDRVQVPMLADVFVPLELSSYISRNLAGDAFPNQLGSCPSDLSKLLKQQELGRVLTIWDLLARTQREPAYRSLAIRALGGYGKTTLLKHIAYTYARKPNRVRYFYKAPRLTPFLLSLRQWRDELTSEQPPTLIELINNHYLPKLPGGKSLRFPPNWVEQCLLRGKALVMFDGFDELADQNRQRISQWIGQSLQDYPESVFIITSRPKAYQSDYIGTPFITSLFVKPFSSNQWQQFIYRWYFYQEQCRRAGSLSTVKALANESADNLIQQIQQRSELADMATNPLLLNMLATFHYFYLDDQLPRKRVELYQAICRMQLEDRPKARQIEMLLPDLNSRLWILQTIALKMVEENRASLNQQQVVKLIAEAMDHALKPFALTGIVSATEFLEQMTDISELLIEREPDEFEFAHRSFQAYLAAVQIRISQQSSLLELHLNDEWWHETIRLYAAQTDPSSLIRSACQIATIPAVTLAYECWKDSVKNLDNELVQKLEVLVENLQILRYQPLKAYLKNLQWQEADYETYRLMITFVDKSEGEWFTSNELRDFPSKEICIIDRLWLDASDGRFGFSIQKRIYKECGGITDGRYDEETWNQYCNRVGWQRGETYNEYDKFMFNLSAPPGHFPSLRTTTSDYLSIRLLQNIRLIFSCQDL
jgi:hypothetical protein